MSEKSVAAWGVPKHISVVKAIKHIQRMRGGAQSHLMLCSDRNLYVVKFRNNPQHLRVLANETLGTLLADLAGLPVPDIAIVEVDDDFIKRTPQLTIRLTRQTIPCGSGLQCGMRYILEPSEGQIFDAFPSSLLPRVRNLGTFAGILAIDKWTCNADRRQAAFWKKKKETECNVTFIDQGHCFNAGEWTFPDSPLRGLYATREVYKVVRGWQSFEPWLSRIESMSATSIWTAAERIPPEWYGSDWVALEELTRTLLHRRAEVRDLLTSSRMSSHNPFPNWP